VRRFSKDQQIILSLLGVFISVLGLQRVIHLSIAPSENKEKTIALQSIIKVTGVVQYPGIYVFEKPPTLMQVIERAGGTTDGLNLDFDSLQHKEIGTGAWIKLKKGNGAAPRLETTSMNPGEKLILGMPVSLNEAALEDLVAVPGLGPSLAKRIVAFRETYGPFESWRDVMRIRGVGPKKVEAFRRYLTL
jgi:competence protein ComEA